LIKPLALLTAILATAASLSAAPVAAATSDAGWAWVAPVGGFLAGGLLICMSIINGRKAKASMQWPSVQGAIVSSEMVMDTSTSSDIATWSPVVTYSYTVNGQALQCSRVKFSPARGKKVVAKYPKGNAVQVFFDPQQPSSAVLEKGGSTKVMLLVGVAVIVGCCLVGVLIGSV
jgi:hypothetical protein